MRVTRLSALRANCSIALSTEAGIDRKLTWVTNTVKHFKWEPRGKRRIHAKPSSLEITACLPWLRAELSLVKPKILVCLGATAAQALLGRQFRITRDRGVLVAVAARAPRHGDHSSFGDSAGHRR